ncbi:MAG: hypothetical protein N6V49_12835, partial [Serratia symbiotica]|nr:hypothetical protein [Serratia symbiotica]
MIMRCDRLNLFGTFLLGRSLGFGRRRYFPGFVRRFLDLGLFVLLHCVGGFVAVFAEGAVRLKVGRR